jgi:hypothetical protein
MVFTSSAHNIAGERIHILQTFCSTNFLPVFLQHNKLTIHWIFNKNQEEITSNFSYKNSRYFWHALSAHPYRQVATSTSQRKCQHKNGVKNKDDKRGRRRDSDSESEYFDYFLIQRSTRGIHYWVFQFIQVQLIPLSLYLLCRDKRSTRIVREQSQSSIAILRPLKTSLFQFLKVRQALSHARFYLKNVFRLFPSGIFFLPELDLLLG